MSFDVRTEEHGDSSAVETRASPFVTGSGLSDPERKIHASDRESISRTPQETTARGHVAETATIPSSPLLEGWRLYTVQIALCLALFLGALDSSIVATALVTIGRDFNNFIQLQWTVLAYLLTDLGCAFIFSRISDIIGRKWASISAVAILTASSLACGLAQSLTQLIVFRAFQGVGGAGVYSMPFTVLPEITPPKNFALLSALSALTFLCSSILGPTLGGVITTQSTWRWIFLFNVPIGVFIMTLMLFAWPKSPSPAAGKISWRELDVIGCLLSIAALVLLVFALQEAGAEAYGWSSLTIITTLTLSGVAAVALYFWIWYLSSKKRYFEPLFHARVVAQKVLGGNAVVSILVGYILFTVLIELPQRFQLVNGTTSQTAGLDLLPFLGSSAAASGLCGWLSREKNRSFYTLTGSSAFIVVGCGLLSSISNSHSVPKLVYLYQVLLGFGVGGTIVSTILIVKLNASEEDAGRSIPARLPPDTPKPTPLHLDSLTSAPSLTPLASAQGLQSQARLLGGNIGLALATIILNIHLTADLNGVLTPQQIRALRQSINVIETFTPVEIAAVVDSFARAFKTQLLVCTGVAAGSLCCAGLAWQRDPPNFVDLGKTLKKGKGKGEGGTVTGDLEK